MKWIMIVTFALIVGCSGKVYTVKSPEFTNGQTQGVLFYGYKPAKKQITMDRIRNSVTGEISHTAYEEKNSPQFCTPVTVSVPTVVADYSTQYAIKYEPGLFETNKFSVELDDGKLKAVNSESTPGVKTAVESLQGLADLRAGIIYGPEKPKSGSGAEMAEERVPLPENITCSSSS